MEPAQVEEAEAEFAKKKAEIEDQMKAESQEREALLKQLQPRLKVSLDDTKNNDLFSLDNYKRDFVQNNETSN